MNWQNIMGPAPGECFTLCETFADRCHAWGGGTWSRSVAACRRETSPIAGRHAWRAGIILRLDTSGRGLGPDIRNIAGGYGDRAATGAPAAPNASAGKADTAASGLTGTGGAGACAYDRRHYAIAISIRRSDADHRPG